MPKKILLIDDDQLVLKSVGRYLKIKGYQVELATSGAEAIEKTKASLFDLVISDVRMPELNGVETLKGITEIYRQQHRDTLPPAVIMTGYSSEAADRQSEALGIVDYLYKPFDLDELLKVVERSLEKLPPTPKVEPPVPAVADRFISSTRDTKDYLRDVRQRFDEFDRENPDEPEQGEFLKENKKDIFNFLDDSFSQLWESVSGFDKERYTSHQKFTQQELRELLLSAEINRRIYEKPLGYSGDYVVMSYIYDYHNDRQYLGPSSYERLINHYTCTIPVSRSNIVRKELLKEKILRIMAEKEGARVLSVGSGPARELTELLEENRIHQPLSFINLDLEKNALDYVRDKIEKIDGQKKRFLDIEYINRDIISIVKDKALKQAIGDCDLVYASGLFDYLSNRMASRLTKELYQLITKGGDLIICNMSLENSTHRGYYELLGGWDMVHRTKEELLNWLDGLDGVQQVTFEKPPGGDGYHFLVTKPR
jgi:CheY-like chemotaxis protein